jgi:hypothetical protein
LALNSGGIACSLLATRIRVIYGFLCEQSSARRRRHRNVSERETSVSRGSEAKKPVSWRAGCVSGIIVLVIAFYLILQSDPANQTRPASPSEQKPEAVTLASLNGRVQPFALQALPAKFDPAGYARLGKRVWSRSNEYRRWVAVAALRNESCKFVDTISVWERATRSKLAWHVVCGDERFVISEAQVGSVRAQLDPDATDADRRKYGAADAPQPMSAAFSNFKVGEAVVACDNMMKEASVDKRSFDPAWSWDEMRNEETGQVVITTEYSGKNAMGGTLSGKYQCVVDAASNRIISLQARDALGAHVVYE